MKRENKIKSTVNNLDSGYKRRPLIEEFKRGINGVIRRKLMKAENQPSSIEQ